MKLTYEAPVAEIEVFETEDVLAASATFVNGSDAIGNLNEINWKDIFS